uniref:Uncharacterized protein n=1 Tax=Ixodes ricinus TaxID=34613 RepID=A0A6B0UN68_IXORI
MSHHCLFVTLRALPFSTTRTQNLCDEFSGSTRGKRVLMPFHPSVCALFLRHLYVSASRALSTPLCSSRFLTPPASALPFLHAGSVTQSAAQSASTPVSGIQSLHRLPFFFFFFKDCLAVTD